MMDMVYFHTVSERNAILSEASNIPDDDGYIHMLRKLANGVMRTIHHTYIYRRKFANI